jgi:channel protein (hemolysin III family)
MTIAPPKLRGWFHLGASPVVLIASLILFIFTKNSLKWAVALYGLSAITLFSVSAIYHRVPWVPTKKKIWRRWDHANINFLIAGSYTPFAVTSVARKGSHNFAERCLGRCNYRRISASLLDWRPSLVLCTSITFSSDG